MGYDYLGTMSRSQWNKMKSFLLSALEIIEQKYDPDDNTLTIDDAIFIRRLKSELVQANREFVLLEQCAARFNNFRGDVPFQKEEVVGDIRTSRSRFNLDDGDTAYNVQKMKDPIRLMFKRKKDNLEYRLKKVYDLIDQLELRVAFFKDYRILLSGKSEPSVDNTASRGTSVSSTDKQANLDKAVKQAKTSNDSNEDVTTEPLPIFNNVISAIEDQFEDGFHTHNLTEDEITDETSGLIVHPNPSNKIDNTGRYFKDQEQRSTYS